MRHKPDCLSLRGLPCECDLSKPRTTQEAAADLAQAMSDYRQPCVPARDAGGMPYCQTHGVGPHVGNYGLVYASFPLDLVGWELPPAGWRCGWAAERDAIEAEVRERIAGFIEAARDAVPLAPTGYRNGLARAAEIARHIGVS